MKLDDDSWYWMITPSMRRWEAVYINIFGEISICNTFIKPSKLKEVTFKKLVEPKRNPYKQATIEGKT